MTAASNLFTEPEQGPDWYKVAKWVTIVGGLAYMVFTIYMAVKK